MEELLHNIKISLRKEHTHLLVQVLKFFVQLRSTIRILLKGPVWIAKLGFIVMKKEWQKTLRLVQLESTVQFPLNCLRNVLLVLLTMFKIKMI